MKNLNVDKQEAQFLDETISYWEKEGLIDQEKAAGLRSSYEVKQFDWRRLAQYSFWIALACGLIAVASLVINDAIINLLQSLYNTPDVLISAIAAGIAVWMYYYGQRQKRKYPERLFSNEATLFSGVLFTAISIAFLGKALDNGSGHFSTLFLLSVFIYGILAWKFQSKLIWAFALISLGSWFGTETGYQTNWSNYFLGLNYPLRFVVFGAVLTAVGLILEKLKKLEGFNTLTYIMGLFYFFISIWILSIFGNLGTIEDWLKTSQISLVYWGILSSGAALLVMLYGLKQKDEIAREFGITFLLINIYTRYFEYMWDRTDKAIFFGILAVSFWLIGRKAEKIWNVK
ncbi:hypothetical protein ADIARSV_1262 [Arcticibacter svalbardensis MN12-7]|uniref:DUF2157 domain-containing protein n=1 Tax=Arcticibacter svalbardensis MN12-7 TaxID=1150600 RepID=R9H310_9SPHI|nr:DUF2157 domain-containing protein [Arcticibacter svalbardensis]EOR95579.1 hypothetical protein ADIARSV_1262 [Arcticibacter svalbardensis MN12-7]